MENLAITTKTGSERGITAKEGNHNARSQYWSDHLQKDPVKSPKSFDPHL